MPGLFADSSEALLVTALVYSLSLSATIDHQPPRRNEDRHESLKSITNELTINNNEASVALRGGTVK